MLINTLERSFISCESSFSEAELVFIGIPFDGTVSFRAGSRMGPSAIRRESIGMETYSPYQNKALEDYKIHDLGDLELPYGNTNRVLDIIENTANSILDCSKKLLSVGGEHLISLPIVKACCSKHSELCILHFDAHTDLRPAYLGEKLSHATVMRRIWDITGDNRIWQFGIRSGTKEEFCWSGEGHTAMEKFTVNTLKEVVKTIGDKPTYVTVDLDILDTSVLPGTGTPEAGGLQFDQLLQALLELKPLNVVGADVVELAPQLDTSGSSTAVACKLVRELMIVMLT